MSHKDAEPILDDYFSCKIGAKECWEKLGYKGAPKLTGKKAYKEYVKRHKILYFKNKIDLLLNKNGNILPVGSELGRISFVSGKEISIRKTS